MRRTVLWLFAIALLSRAVIALLQIAYGINNQVNLDVYLYGPFNPGFEIYHDFYGYYVVQLADLSKGLIPYKNFGYSYPPLFLYALYPFFSLGGQYAASIPILLTDAATSPLIYLLARRYTSQKISVIAGLSYALSPFFLLYEGYLWFSSQPMTFFLLLSFYLLLIEKPVYSSAALALSILFKQEIIFVLPVYLLMYATHFKKDLFKGLTVLCALIFLISLPFLIIAPTGYVASVSYSTLAHSYIPLSPSGNQTSSISSASSQTSASLTCNTLSNTWRSLVCNYGGFTYTDHKVVVPWTVIFTGPFLNTISFWIAVPLFVIASYYLLILRKNENVFLLSSALLLMAFVSIFDFEVHSVYRYYNIPVYALILASSNSRGTLLIASVIPVLTLFLPSGPVQLIPPLFSILALLIINYSKTPELNFTLIEANPAAIPLRT